MSNDTMTAEAQALHAVLADDLDDARRILRDFLPGELWTLQKACGLLGVLCIDVRRDPPPATTGAGPVAPSRHGSRPRSRTDASRAAGPGAVGAARTPAISPPPTSEGGVNAAPPELGEDPSN